MPICLNCSKETSNPKFCSRSCAAIVNNVTSPKRKPTNKCKGCDTLISSSLWYCPKCKPKTIKNKQLSEVIYTQHHKSSAFALVRSNARYIAKTLNYNSCKNCGYNKHIEICHIKPIHEFEPSALISDINNPSNLLPLCPNCHWEFDHGLLVL